MTSLYRCVPLLAVLQLPTLSSVATAQPVPIYEQVQENHNGAVVAAEVVTTGTSFVLAVHNTRLALSVRRVPGPRVPQALLARVQGSTSTGARCMDPRA